MDDAHLAESMLELVAPADHAAAVIGDLIEEAPRRGRRWFWLSVVRTALAFVWRDIATRPISTVFQAALGCVGFPVLAFLCAAFVVFSVITLLAVGSLVFPGWVVDLPGDAVMSRLVGASVLMIAPFEYGRAVARQWREHAAAVVATQAVIWLTCVLAFSSNPVLLAQFPAVQLFMLAGLVWQRRADLRKTARSLA
jgi:hypothetical protein